MKGMTATKEAAAGNYNSDFAKRRAIKTSCPASPPGGLQQSNSEAGEQELKIFIGPTFALRARPRADMANQKSPGTNTVELIFAPAAAVIIFTNETGEDTGVSLANAGYDPNEARIPAGQPGGGQWTAAGAGGAQITKAPSSGLVLSGGNDWRLGESLPDLTGDSGVEPITWGEEAEVSKGYGDAITETVRAMWNAALFPITAAWDPITTAKGVGEGVTHLVKDPGGTLRAIGRQIADDFTGGDLRKAAKLVGLVLISSVDPESAPEDLASLLPKVEAAAAGETVRFTAEEAGTLQRTFQGIGSTGQVGEDALKALGGESQVYFKTSLTGRFIDQLVDQIAHESKVGYHSLTPTIQLQIDKDAELMLDEAVKGATWHFFESPVTGLGGPSKSLLNALQRPGIKVVIH